MSRTKQMTLFANDSCPPESLVERIDRFRRLPYRIGEFRRKNWGSPLHSLCSYPSKLKPAIAHILVSWFTEPGMRVLDPFSGSGTVPLEACLQGRAGVGCDLSPLAYRLTMAKITFPPPTQVNALVDDLATELTRAQDAVVIDAPEKVAAFYHQDTLKEILIARAFLESRLNEGLPAAFMLWSALAHILHGNRPYALSRRSHNIIPIPPKGELVYKSLVASLKAKLGRVYAGWRPEGLVPGQAYHSDAANICLTEPVDVIITSPPFLGTTEFLKQNWLRMWFCGWTIDVIESRMLEFLEYSKDLAVYERFFDAFRGLVRANGLVILHLGVVKSLDMGVELRAIAIHLGFEALDLIYEDVAGLENHGRTDRGGTHQHQFLFLRSSGPARSFRDSAIAPDRELSR